MHPTTAGTTVTLEFLRGPGSGAAGSSPESAAAGARYAVALTRRLPVTALRASIRGT